jgi:hypothetical protein
MTPKTFLHLRGGREASASSVVQALCDVLVLSL